MKWVFIDYGRYLKQSKDPLPHRDNAVEFDVRTNAKDLEKNIKLQVWPSDLQDKVKDVVTDYWDVFFEDGLRQPTHRFIFHIDTGNHPPTY